MKTPRKHARSLLAALWLGTAGPAIGDARAAEPGDAGASGVAVRGVVIPTGFENGKYTALLQIAVDGSPLGGAAWRLAAQHVSPGGGTEALSGRVVVAEPRTAAVVEIQAAFAPGLHVLILEGEESAGGQTGSGRTELTLPDPSAGVPTVSPVAIVQPVEAMFSRDGEARPRGALARTAGEPVLYELPAALVSVVCRQPNSPGAAEVERALEGRSDVQRFETVVLPAGGEPCAQIRDLIRPGTMTEGFFRYDVRVVVSGRQVAAGSREFRAAAGTGPKAGGGRD